MAARIFRNIWSADPIWTALLSMAAGLLLSLASVPLGLAFVRYEVGGMLKQVGFVPALSWSVTLVFLLPAALFAALWAARQLGAALRAAPERRLLAGPGFTVLGPEAGDALADRLWRISAPIGFFLIALALMVGVWDFATVVVAPLSAGALPIAADEVDAVLEIDWSLAPLLGTLSPDPAPSVTATLIFAALAYLLAFAQIALLLSFFAVLLGLALTLHGLIQQPDEMILTPDARSRDRRRGFEHFEPFFLSALAALLLTYVCCYFMRVQNLFIRDPNFVSIDAMLFGYIGESLSEKIIVPHDLQSFLYLLGKTVLRLLRAVFEAGDLMDFQAYLGIGMIVTGVSAIFLSLFVILRSAAAESRARVETALRTPETAKALAKYYRLDEATLRGRLRADSMDVWPLLWPRLNSFLAFLALGVACFIFYRLALFWLTIQLWRLIRWRRRD